MAFIGRPPAFDRLDNKVGSARLAKRWSHRTCTTRWQIDIARTACLLMSVHIAWRRRAWSRSAKQVGERRYRESFGRYYEDFEVGDIYEHRPGRTITRDRQHLVHAADDEHAPAALRRGVRAGTPSSAAASSPRRFTVSLMVGMSVTDVSQKAIANLGWTDIKLHASGVRRRHALCRERGAGQARVEVAARRRHRHRAHRPARTRTARWCAPSTARCWCSGAATRSKTRRTTDGQHHERRQRAHARAHRKKRRDPRRHRALAGARRAPARARARARRHLSGRDGRADEGARPVRRHHRAPNTAGSACRRTTYARIVAAGLRGVDVAHRHLQLAPDHGGVRAALRHRGAEARATCRASRPARCAAASR